MYRLIVLVCCISAINAAAAFVESKNRIIGGKSINIEDAPYQVRVYHRYNKKNYCGGSIISPNYILTAAHCAYLWPQTYRIRIGSSKSTEDGELHDVNAVIIHEDYHDGWDYETMTKSVPINDIALMRIEPAVNANGKNIEIIGLPKQGEKFTGENAFLTGWGYIATGETSNLQGLTVQVVRREECDKDYSFLGGIRDGQICAEHRDQDKDICNGDSGGPLIVAGKQIGVVSWSGPGCAIPGRPGVYTEVAAYRDWIDKHVKA